MTKRKRFLIAMIASAVFVLWFSVPTVIWGQGGLLVSLFAMIGIIPVIFVGVVVYNLLPKESN